MNDHFIKNIEIKNFKCFEDFKAEGFGRVNLIGGKNNVGKTAFMEACWINVHILKVDIDFFLSALYRINFFREKINMFISNDDGVSRVEIEDVIEKYNEVFFKTNLTQLQFIVRKKLGIKEYIFKFFDEEFIIKVNDLSLNLPHFKQMTFLDNFSFSDSKFKEFYASVQEKEEENYLNKILYEFDSKLKNFKIINDIPYCKVSDTYLKITELGSGVSHLVSIVLSLFHSSKGYLFIDEIGYGIHYTNLDKLWEIILTISKQQNVQVFASTHSKECIESYARVAKELEDNEITFFKLGHNKKGELKGMVYPYDWFVDSVEQEQELRGW